MARKGKGWEPPADAKCVGVNLAAIEGASSGPAVGRVSVMAYVATKNPSNNLRHWRTLKREADAQKAAVMVALSTVPESFRKSLAGGCMIRLTRISSGQVERLNLDVTLKHVIDQIALWAYGGKIGQFDDDGRIEWKNCQEKGKRGQPAVRIEIEPRPIQ